MIMWASTEKGDESGSEKKSAERLTTHATSWQARTNPGRALVVRAERKIERRSVTGKSEAKKGKKSSYKENSSRITTAVVQESANLIPRGVPQ